MSKPRKFCQGCECMVAVTKDGKFYKHNRWLGAGFEPEPCPGKP